MQNRNRNLLFGPRVTPGIDAKMTTDSEAFEADNQQSIDHLRGSASTIKDIALQVDTSVNEQNRMLDRMVSYLPVSVVAIPIRFILSNILTYIVVSYYQRINVLILPTRSSQTL